MVTSFDQAVRVQQARVRRGQKGHSKAVRRYLKRGLDLGNIHSGEGGGTFRDYTAYLAAKMDLPFLGRFPM